MIICFDYATNHFNYDYMNIQAKVHTSFICIQWTKL